MRELRRALAITAALAVALVAGCASEDGVANRGSTGYVSGDGQVEEFPAGDRDQAPEFGGTLASGETWSSTDHAGQIMVVNFWYASCPPCRVEAPFLADLATTNTDVTFVGVNVRDGAAAVDAFDERFGIPYPSILDADTGGAQLAFSGTITPTAVPTTLVIGSDGSIAARISGAVPDASILQTLIDDERS